MTEARKEARKKLTKKKVRPTATTTSTTPKTTIGATNQLDADCAALISNSLIYNKNLQLLDISKNLLGDFGVYLLLTPLIRKNLQE